jgi:hypothetical protein
LIPKSLPNQGFDLVMSFLKAGLVLISAFPRIAISSFRPQPICSLRQPFQRFSTSMPRDTTAQSDISKANATAVDKDGSFKRAVSSFQNHVVKGGQFAPEKGELSLGQPHCSCARGQAG